MSTDFQNPRASARGAVNPPDWPTADRAYQQHHVACPQCRAAGTSPNTQQRCEPLGHPGAPGRSLPT